MLADIEAMEASNVVGRPKFSPDNHPDLSLPGGENYREVLLRLPEQKVDMSYDAGRLKQLENEYHGLKEHAIDDPNFGEEKYNEMIKLMNIRDNSTTGSLYAEADDAIRSGQIAQRRGNNAEAEYHFRQYELLGTRAEKLDLEGLGVPKPARFTQGHYDEPNVLAHMRLNDRTGPNGEKILFVEEIQSDWHQKGRKQGYRTPTGKLSAEKIDPKFGEGWAIKDENGQQIIIINNPTTVKLADGNFEYKNITNSEEAIKAAQEQLNNPDRYGAIKDNLNKRVPDAPLKKTWHEMSFRRIARMAAEEGYDAIAWTPGKMQAERYDLSKRISEISYDPDTKKLFAYEKDGYSPVISEVVSEDKLADYIGKEAAERLLATTRKTIPTNKGDTSQHILKGADLEVGGEGMKGFYDKMLKGYASKWGKKFGAKVGVTDLKDAAKV